MSKILLLAAISIMVAVAIFTVSNSTSSTTTATEIIPVFGEQQPNTVISLKNSLLFSHPNYGFSVEIPKSYIIKRFDEGQSTETIIVEPENDDFEVSTPRFQIFVTPYFENIITKERILKDTGGSNVTNQQEVIIGKSKDIHALLFKSTNVQLGEVREVWFIHRGYLYIRMLKTNTVNGLFITKR